jgi:hypothetical protein
VRDGVLFVRSSSVCFIRRKSLFYRPDERERVCVYLFQDPSSIVIFFLFDARDVYRTVHTPGSLPVKPLGEESLGHPSKNPKISER